MASGVDPAVEADILANHRISHVKEKTKGLSLGDGVPSNASAVRIRNLPMRVARQRVSHRKVWHHCVAFCLVDVSVSQGIALHS